MPKTLDDFYRLSNNAVDDMAEARANVKWSSRIFNNAQDKNKELRDKLNFYNQPDRELTSAEIADLRKTADEARNAFEQYDDRFKKKVNPAQNTARRGEIVADGLTFINELLEELDKKEAALENKPVNSAKEMGTETAKLNTALEEGTQDVKFGSNQYKESMLAMKKYEQLLEKHANEDGVIDKNSFTAQEIEEMTGLLRKAERGSNEYLKVKENKDLNKNPKMAKRNHTMGDVRDLARAHLKKLDAIKDTMEKEPSKELDVLSKDAADTVLAIEVAQKGVHSGSKEYDDAQKEFNHVNTLLKETQEVEKYEFNSYQRRLFNANLSVAEKAIDKYLEKKADKEKLDPKEQRRVDAMRKAKNSILETRKKINEVNKEEKDYASKINAEDLEGYLQDASEELEKGSRALRASTFNGGSEEYKNGKKAYLEAVNDAKNVFKDDRYKKMTTEERQKVIDKLTESRRTVENYVVKKHSKVKDKDLNENGRIRMGAMYKAHSGITFMIDKLQAENDLEKERESKYNQAEFDKKVSDRLGSISIADKKGLERTKNTASRDAVKALARFGKNENLSPSEVKAAKYALATLLLDERLSGLSEKERKKYPKSPKEYAKLIKKTAESKEFAKRFPDSKITAANCRKYASDPKECKKAMRSLFGEISKVNNFERQRVKPREIKPEPNHLPGK